MEKIIVRGGNKLNGTVEIEGAKNAVLPILAASILPTEGRTVLHNVPILSDVFTMNNVIRFLRERGIGHFQRFGGCLGPCKEKMDTRNVYLTNPAFDKQMPQPRN